MDPNCENLRENEVTSFFPGRIYEFPIPPRRRLSKGFQESPTAGFSQSLQTENKLSTLILRSRGLFCG